MLDLLETPRGALVFLKGMAGKTYSSRGVKYFFKLEDVTLYAPFEKVIQRLDTIPSDSFSREEIELASEFRRLVDRRNAGYPDNN